VKEDLAEVCSSLVSDILVPHPCRKNKVVTPTVIILAWCHLATPRINVNPRMSCTQIVELMMHEVQKTDLQIKSMALRNMTHIQVTLSSFRGSGRMCQSWRLPLSHNLAIQVTHLSTSIQSRTIDPLSFSHLLLTSLGGHLWLSS
jgi:hypothetical protein